MGFELGEHASVLEPAAMIRRIDKVAESLFLRYRNLFPADFSKALFSTQKSSAIAGVFVTRLRWKIDNINVSGAFTR